MVLAGHWAWDCSGVNCKGKLLLFLPLFSFTGTDHPEQQNYIYNSNNRYWMVENVQLTGRHDPDAVLWGCLRGLPGHTGLPLEASRAYTCGMPTRAARAGFFLPTDPTKPPPSGSGKPDRFDRLPKNTGQIQISNKKWQFNRFPPVSWPVRPVYRFGLTGYRSVWVVTGRFDR